MNNFFKLFIIALISSSGLSAEEIKCNFVTGTNNKSSLVDFVTSCGAAKSLSANNEIITNHKKEILEKLS